MNLKLGMFALLVAVGLAQSPRPVFDEFEVATIKRTDPDWRGGRFITMQTAHQFVAKHHAVKTLIAAAYNLTPQAISGGPAWVDSERYDIVAVAPTDIRPNLDEQMLMLRKLLADRFALTFHREPKQLPIYALTVARSGSKLRDSTTSPDTSPQGPPPLVFRVTLPVIQLPGRYATMAEFASVLQRSALDRPVMDQTGLPGRYDFDLEFTPNESQFGGAFGRITDDAARKPGLFAAIQEQLGLRLEATKGPVETLVMDKVERPSEN